MFLLGVTISTPLALTAVASIVAGVLIYLLGKFLLSIVIARNRANERDISEGDQVITSKLSSSFPGGLLVGEVIKVQFSESSPTIDCIIRPAVSLTQIEEVLVVQSSSNL